MVQINGLYKTNHRSMQLINGSSNSLMPGFCNSRRPSTKKEPPSPCPISRAPFPLEIIVIIVIIEFIFFY